MTLAAIAVVCSLPAAAATPTSWLRSGSWPDNRHGWVGCYGSEVCSTENGGRSWHSVFSGGNFLFSVARTSSRAGVVQTGNWVGESFWTRTNGKRWYELPNVPTPNYLGGDKGLVFEGRGSRLYWHQGGSSLNQITPWPAPADPPCRGSAGLPNTCVLSLADSPFSSSVVATIGDGVLGWMRSIPGGVAVLVHASDPILSPSSVLVHREIGNELFELPDPPVSRRSLTCTDFATRWPLVIVSARSARLGEDDCRDLPLVLWRSKDGGTTWTVETTKRVHRVGARTPPRRWDARVAVPGGWVARSKGQPAALEIRQLKTTRTFVLPGARPCRVRASLMVSWPTLFVTGVRSDQSTPIRWLSQDGGATWSVLGGC